MVLSRIELSDLPSPEALLSALLDQIGTIQGPVPVEDIARRLGIQQISKDRFDGFEGMLLTDTVRSRGGILVNTSRGARRARFTTSHELGHFLMEWHEPSTEAGFRCRAEDLRETSVARRHQRQETQANTFAIGLLAPIRLVRPLLSSQPDLRDALQLRDTLDISFEAATRRMIDLREEPLGLVFSRDGRIRYTVRNTAMPWINPNPGAHLPAGSQATQVVRSGNPGVSAIVDADPLTWIADVERSVREQTWIGNSGYAITLLRASGAEDRQAKEPSF